MFRDPSKRFSAAYGSGPARAGSRSAATASEGGAALLTVLSVLTVLAIGISILVARVRAGIKPWAREWETTQALYTAESGIAFQLYLERYSDSAEPAFGKAAAPDTGTDPFSSTAFRAPADTFAFRMDSTQSAPDTRVDRTRAFLDITSKGTYRNAEVTVTARFGKALDADIFGPALTLDNSAPLEPFPNDRVFGSIRLKTPSPGLLSAAWPTGFSVTAYTAEFTDKKYYASESALQKQLAETGGIAGNGNYSPDDPPDFRKSETLFFPLGSVELSNQDDEPWVIKGPGRIYCEGEIRIKGLIRLDNVQLLSGKDVIFEDSITGDGISVFARGNVIVNNRCNLGLEAVAGKDIWLNNTSQTAPGSVLLSAGNKHAGKPGDTVNAIRVVNEAVARGFLIAAGPNGRVVVGTKQNRVEGVVMASSVWLTGEVRGPVLARQLLCEGTNTRNCLGDGKIDRGALPVNFVQPLQLGPQDRRLYVFKLMDWKRT